MEASVYMYGHGFSLMFLACVYGEEDDIDRRKRAEKILTKAVEFSGKAQTNHGGWGYVTAHEGQGFDEGSVTITQLQGLRAAKNAGIVVPKTIIDKSVDYLKKCTTERGGIIYSLSMGGMAAAGQERPALTAAGIACSFSAGQYDSDLAKRWLQYCRTAIGTARKGTLLDVSAFDLGTWAVQEALARSGVPAEDVDDIVLGEVLQGGGDIARWAALESGLVHVPGVAHNRHCASGMAAVQTAAGSIRAGTTPPAMPSDLACRSHARPRSPMAAKARGIPSSPCIEGVAFDAGGRKLFRYRCLALGAS